MRRTRISRGAIPADRAANNVGYAVLLGLICGVAGPGAILLASNTDDGVASRASQLTTDGAAGEIASAINDANARGPRPAHHALPKKHLFADSFDDPESSDPNWLFNGPWWKIANGALHAGPVSGWAELWAFAPHSDFRSGTLSLEASLDGGSGYDVLFGLSGDLRTKKFDGYALRFDAGYENGFLLTKWVNGVEVFPPLARSYPGTGYPWRNVPHHIELSTEGPLITAKIDGQIVFSVVVPDYTGGKIGFRLWNEADATFDDVRITPLSR